MNNTFKLLIFFLILISSGIGEAGSIGVGIHSGYGVIEYEERSSSWGSDLESKSSQNVVLFGVSGEYSFSELKNFYAGITTDWALGLKDNEVWEEDDIQIQTNDMRISAQFYDFRFGYKNIGKDYYYRLYVSGGWDGIHFKRDKFLKQGETVPGSITEDISLWRTGAGAGFGYSLGEWALDARIAYAYFPVGKVENSSLPQFTFETNGVCFDMGVGIARKIAEKTSFYIGGSYTLIELDESDKMRSGLLQAVYPKSRTEMIIGVVNLSYSF